MTDFITLYLLPAGLAGSLLCALLFICRPLLNSMGARFKKTVWLFAALLWVLPLAPLARGAKALLQKMPQGSAALPAGEGTLAAAPVYNAGAILHTAIQPNAAGSAANTMQGGVSLSPMQILAWVYFAGVIISFLFLAVRFVMFKTRLKRSVALVDNQKTIDDYKEICTEYKIKKPPALLQSKLVQAPCIAGLLRPAIILPHNTVPRQWQSFALRHELMHYRHRDLPVQTAIRLLACLHWFNPLIYVLQEEYMVNCEQHCDERVLNGQTKETRRRYASALLGFASPEPAQGAGFTSPARRLKKRMQNILVPAHKKQGKSFFITAVLLTGFLAATFAGCSFAAGANNNTPEPALSQAFAGVLAKSDISEAGEKALPNKSSNINIGAANSTNILEAEQDEYLMLPVPEFSHSPRGFEYERHLGRDFNAPEGTEIIAAADGVVAKAEYHYSYGYYIIIKHAGGLSTLYAHCHTLYAEEGDTVKAGDVIATVGRTGNVTGNNCHFEVRQEDAKLSILNPDDFFKEVQENPGFFKN